MKQSSFRILKISIVIILGVILMIGGSRGNELLPLIVFPLALLILVLAKSRLSERYEDERTYHIARRAAHYAFIIFSIATAITLNVLIALGSKTGNGELSAAGISLSLALLFLLLVYLAAYFLISRKS